MTYLHYETTTGKIIQIATSRLVKTRPGLGIAILNISREQFKAWNWVVDVVATEATEEYGYPTAVLVPVNEG